MNNLCEKDMDTILSMIANEKLYNRATNITKIENLQLNQDETFPDGSPIYEIEIETENEHILKNFKNKLI